MSMLEELAKVQLEAARYRLAVDRFLSQDLTASGHWQTCFSEILICTTRLYLGYLLVRQGSRELELLAFKKGGMRLNPVDNGRERKLRAELIQRLQSSTSWPGFIPQNPFSDVLGLKSLRDYVNAFTLHLPEIYEETFRVEASVESFLATRKDSALAQLSVGLQHLGRNHASFVLPALEWAADEGSWNESLVEKGA